MKVAEKASRPTDVEFPAGSFIIDRRRPTSRAARAAVDAARPHGSRAVGTAPTVATHDADAPRVAIYSQWSGTQELGWYRHAFDQFGIPFDLIYKERVQAGQPQGRLRRDRDGGAEHQPRAGAGAAGRAAAALPEEREVQVPRDVRRDRPTRAAASARRASTRSQAFLEAGGTLITTRQRRALPDRVRASPDGGHRSR